jgi:hypothetical protein
MLNFKIKKRRLIFFNINIDGATLSNFIDSGIGTKRWTLLIYFSIKGVGTIAFKDNGP